MRLENLRSAMEGTIKQDYSTTATRAAPRIRGTKWPVFLANIEPGIMT